MSGTVAPDPRVAAIYAHRMHHDGNIATMLAVADAADRAAGVIRVRVDDATVEKVAAALYAEDGYYPWYAEADKVKAQYHRHARAVLEALVTP